MVYEAILEGLSVGSVSDYVSVTFTSDGKRDIYEDFNKILGLLSGTDYLYVVVFRHGKRHIHMVIRNCLFYKTQLKDIWTWICSCPKFDFESVKDVVAIAVYLSTQDSIEFVDCSGGWC